MFLAIRWTCLEDILWTKCLSAWLPTHGELEDTVHLFFKMDQASYVKKLSSVNI
jgi:hypothetical protein